MFFFCKITVFVQPMSNCSAIMDSTIGLIAMR